MIKTILTYSSFAIACLLVVVIFLTAATFTQLGFAAVLFPILAVCAYQLFLRNDRQCNPSKPKVVQKPPSDTAGISDINKRVFLKMLGGTGLFLFISAILSKKNNNLFSGTTSSTASGVVLIKDPAGNPIVPAQSQITDGYQISEIDDNIIAFYGFTNKDGAWYIMRVDAENGSTRYSTGGSNFPSNWDNREKLKYDYFYNAFKHSP